MGGNNDIDAITANLAGKAVESGSTTPGDVNAIGSTIEGSLLSGLLTLVEIDHLPRYSGGNAGSGP